MNVNKNLIEKNTFMIRTCKKTFYSSNRVTSALQRFSCRSAANKLKQLGRPGITSCR